MPLPGRKGVSELEIRLLQDLTGLGMEISGTSNTRMTSSSSSQSTNLVTHSEVWHFSHGVA
jgi:hypothetical protein